MASVWRCDCGCAWLGEEISNCTVGCGCGAGLKVTVQYILAALDKAARSWRDSRDYEICFYNINYVVLNINTIFS